MTTWPRLRVEWYDPTRKEEILTREQAQERFGLSAQDLAWLDSPYVFGTGLHGSSEVRTLSRYTLRDSIRDAAPELLEALKMAECEFVTLAARVTPAVRSNLQAAVEIFRAAIAKAEGKGGAK